MTIAVAMSGGLDSSLAAWLLAKGDELVIGLSMQLWDHRGEAVHGRCCGALDLGDARRVAEQCGIAHYTLRMEETFRDKVVDPFVDGYLDGRTPVPCTSCNTWIKFGLFLERARELGAEAIATGHYARLEQTRNGYELHAARDEAKDQSYYLFELTQEQLAATRFPLGEMSKQEVRRRAREIGLLVADKPESMELCFVPGTVREFVEQEATRRPGGSSPGSGAAAVRTRDGRRLGTAGPYYGYTVGQRRGLGVASGEKLYVLELRPEDNEVVVGTHQELMATGLEGRGAHWIGTDRPQGEFEARVKIRARHAGVGSRVRYLADGGAQVIFDEPQAGVAPGQAAVFYRGTRVLGGCWIESSIAVSGAVEDRRRQPALP